MTGFLDTAAVNGALVPTAEGRLPITDDGLLRGDGAFEVIRVLGGAPLWGEEHLERLEHSASILRLTLDRQQIAAEVEALLGAIGPRDCLLQVAVTRGGSRVVLAREPPPARAQVSLAVVPHCPTPLLAGAKTLSYAANMLATRLAQERGFDEALLVDSDGHVLEGSRSAFFWVEDDTVHAPPLDAGVLASITREKLASLTPFAESRRRLADLEAASELFLADTPGGITPVHRVEELGDFAAPGPVTGELRMAFQGLVESELQP